MFFRLLGGSWLFEEDHQWNIDRLIGVCVVTGVALSIIGTIIYHDQFTFGGWIATVILNGLIAVIWAFRLTLERFDTVLAAEEDARTFTIPRTRGGELARLGELARGESLLDPVLPVRGVVKRWPGADPANAPVWTRNTHLGTTITMVSCVFAILFQFAFAVFGVTPWTVAALFMFSWSFGLFGDLTVRHFLVDPHHVDGPEKRRMIRIGMNIATLLMVVNATGFVLPLGFLFISNQHVQTCIDIERERKFRQEDYATRVPGGNFCQDDWWNGNCRASEGLCR